MLSDSDSAPDLVDPLGLDIRHEQQICQQIIKWESVSTIWPPQAAIDMILCVGIKLRFCVKTIHDAVLYVVSPISC